MMTSMSIFDDDIKSQFLVCNLHTSHVTQWVTPPNVISQGVTLVQILSSYLEIKFLESEMLGGYTLPQYASIVEKRCSLEGIRW